MEDFDDDLLDEYLGSGTFDEGFPGLRRIDRLTTTSGTIARRESAHFVETE